MNKKQLIVAWIMRLSLFLISTQFLISTFCWTPLSAKEEKNIPDIREVLSGNPSQSEVRELIDAIKEKIKENPADYTLYEALAFSYDYIGSYEKSLEAIKQQIKYHPDNNEDLGIVYGNLARQYLNLGKPDEAKPAIDKSLELAPKDIINHRHLLNYYVLKRQYKELAIELKAISDLDKESDFYEVIYWLINDKIKTYDEKINLFKEALNVNPGNAFAHKAYAMILKESAYSNRKYKEALPTILAEYNKALELKPKYVFTYIAIGNTYLLAAGKDKKEYFKDAMEWFKKAEKLEPNNLKVQYAMGNMFYYTGEYDKAISKLEYAFDRGLNDQSVIDMLMNSYNNKAVSCYTKKKDFKKGLELVDKALQFNPNAEFPLSTKAELLFKMGRTKEAEEYIQKIIAVKPDTEFFARLGCEQQNINDFELAKRYYQESLKLDQDNAKTICNLGLVYTSLKEYDKAIDLFSRYIKLNPADFRGYYNLGVVYNNMGNKGSALKQVAKLSELKKEALAKELESVIKSGKIADGKAKLLNE